MGTRGWNGTRKAEASCLDLEKKVVLSNTGIAVPRRSYRFVQLWLVT